MKKIKKLLTIGLAVVLMLCVSINFVGCGYRGQILENEYYIYQLNYSSDDIAIIGLTNIGKEQEYLVIPETIGEKK